MSFIDQIATAFGVVKGINDIVDGLQMTADECNNNSRVLRAVHAAAHALVVSLRGVGKYFKTGESYVYALHLEGGNYYVGTTCDLEGRLFAHFNGSGALWTKLHKPIMVIEVRPGGRKEEDDLTLEYMALYSYQRVRGGSWCSVEMSNSPKRLHATESLPDLGGVAPLTPDRAI